MLFGDRARPPMPGERPDAYRLAMAKDLQKYSKPWVGVKLRELPPSALKIAEQQIYADAQIAAKNPVDLPEDRLVEIQRRDPVTGMNSFEFRGRQTFIHLMKRPSMRVIGMKTGRE